MSEKKPKKEKKYILYLFDSDPLPSPFDINVGYDAGFDVVVPFGGVDPKKIRSLIEDAMFSRGVKGARRTKVFINGSDLDTVQQNLKIAKESMVPPFELSIFVDPRGGWTTGAATVAQVASDLNLIGKSKLEECKVVVFGGTGMVGQVCAVLCAKFGAEVTLLSRRQEKAERIAGLLKEYYGVDVIPKAMGDDDNKAELCKNADIVLTCGTAGVQLVPRKVLEAIKGTGKKIFADVNAVPPLGIEGIDAMWFRKEVEDLPGFYFYGALALGDLKLKIERKGLKKLKEAEGGKVFDFMDFYELAMKIIADSGKK